MLVWALTWKLALLLIASGITARQWQPKQATRAQIVARARKSTPYTLRPNFQVDENDDWQEFDLIGDHYIRRKREYTNSRLRRRQGPSGTPTPAAGTVHASCSDDSECNAGLGCNGEQCLFNYGEDCSTGVDGCQPGYICRYDNVCGFPSRLYEPCSITIQCNLNLECPNGEYCTRVPRSLELGDSCVASNDCQSGYCDASNSCAACSSASQCDTGLFCRSGVCSS